MPFDEIFSSEPESTPQESAPQDPSSATPGSEPAAGSQAPADEWEVPGVGRVTRDELIKGYLRTQDYTRKTMALSGREREYEQLTQQSQALEATLTQIRSYLQDRAWVARHLQALGGSTQESPELAPDAILTAAEAQAMVQRKLGESEQAWQKRLESLEERITTSSYRQQYEGMITAKLTEIGHQHPELKSVPGMEVLLREAVRNQKPATIEEALALYEQAGAFYAERLKGLAKTAALAPNNPLLKGIQPPNHAAPAAEQTTTEFTGVRDPNLRNQVIADLEAILRR
jgi:chaperonin cofactor prefoldin